MSLPYLFFFCLSVEAGVSWPNIQSIYLDISVKLIRNKLSKNKNKKTVNMKLIPMETFCCCCKLETGGLIMGILATITSVSFFISSLFSYSESMDNIRDHFLLTDLLKDGPDHVVHIVFITMTAIDVGSSVLLLVGVLKVSIDDCRIHLCGTMCNYFRFWKSCLSNESRRRNFTYILHEMPQQYIIHLWIVIIDYLVFFFHVQCSCSIIRK